MTVSQIWTQGLRYCFVRHRHTVLFELRHTELRAAEIYCCRRHGLRLALPFMVAQHPHGF